MLNSYSLEILSQHQDFKNKNLRKYNVEGIETVGVYGNESFEILFKNHTAFKVQVKFSIDGTDILTGELATTEPTKNMWVVNGYQTLSIKSWPETNEGGAQLIFSDVNNSVAVHTHGDLSSRGIIAAAVYIEGECNVQPYYIPYFTPIYPVYDFYYDYYGSPSYFGEQITCGTTITGVSLNNDNGSTSSNVTLSNVAHKKESESLAAVGAGQYVDQKITYIVGLNKPVFTESIRVRYLWWDSLLEKLKLNNAATPNASGFPADKKKLNINLGHSPRINNYYKSDSPQGTNYERI